MVKKVFIALFVVLALAAIFSEDDPVKVTQSPDSTQNPATRPEPEGTWPYLQHSKSAQISDDLLRTNIYVVLDGSGSMENAGCSGDAQKIDAAKRALINFSKIVPANANLGLLVFDGKGISERAPLSHGNRKPFNEAVLSVRADSATPLKTAIGGAYEQLTKQARSQLGYGTYHLVVVTDGEANKGEDPRHIVSSILHRSPITVHTIGFCIKTTHSLNQPGKVLYHTANDYAGLKSGLESVLAESDQFTVEKF